MKKLTVLGTGHATVTKCYNTCFTISNNKEHFLIDAGGGNGILTQLNKANINITSIKNMFISHNHIDHLLGSIWIIRMIAQACIGMSKEEYKGNFNIYCSEETKELLELILKKTLLSKLYDLVGVRIHINKIEDRQMISILNKQFEFIDLKSPKDLQFGFICYYQKNKKLIFLGDEPYNQVIDKELENADYLLTEAFCLYSEREKFKPYEKFHNTVKEGAELGEKFAVKNLVLWHTEEENLENRKELYTKEAKKNYNGNIFVPNDLEIIELK